MSEKKYQVFISSTYKDLIEERRDIARSVLDLGHIPAAMEYFPAMDEEQLEYIKRIIDECDYYVLVIAGKYGSMDDEGISYTEREYSYALSKNKIVLGFPIADMTKLSRSQTEIDETIVKKLEAFRDKLMTGRLIRTWQDRKDLDLAIVKGLSAAFQRFPQEGWVRTPRNSNENLLEQIIFLKAENDELRDKLDRIKPAEGGFKGNLAELDEIYEFLYEVSDATDNIIFRHEMELSWQEIFVQFASSVRSGVGPSEFRSNFVDRLGTRTFRKSDFDPGIMWARIRDHDFSVICAQLTAYGFVYINDDDRFVLTAEGHEAYLTNITIKTKRGD